MHSDVGGGYPDDGLSFVPLCWMIDEARKNNGLRFENAIVETYRALASPTGRLYDSRSGLGGALWRYQPRNVQLLMDNRDESVLKQNRITPLVKESGEIVGILTAIAKKTNPRSPATGTPPPDF